MGSKFLIIIYARKCGSGPFLFATVDLCCDGVAQRNYSLHTQHSCGLAISISWSRTHLFGTSINWTTDHFRCSVLTLPYNKRSSNACDTFAQNVNITALKSMQNDAVIQTTDNTIDAMFVYILSSRQSVSAYFSFEFDVFHSSISIWNHINTYPNNKHPLLFNNI